MAKRAVKRNVSGPPDSADIQYEIQAAGYSWTAAPLALPEKPGLGLRVDPQELAAMRAAVDAENRVASLAAAFAAPAAVDWRNNNGNWVSPIRNQLSCGSCVSFACCATIESRLKIACRNAGLGTDLSEAHLFFCGCGNCCNNGWNFAPALNHCKTTGVGLESEFPYTPQDQPCRNITAHVKIDAWHAVYAQNERKSLIADKGPVVAGMAVYSDFYSYGSGVYRKTPSATLEGYHAVSVVGYDDAQRCWIAKNSWGPNWGESGFFRIGYGEAEMDTTFPFYDVTVTCPREPADECSRYVPFLRQVLAVARTDWRLRNCLRYYVCRRIGRPTCTSRELQIVRYVSIILQACPQYRDAFCRLLG